MAQLEDKITITPDFWFPETPGIRGVEIELSDWYDKKIKEGKINFSMTGCLCTLEERRRCPCKNKIMRFVMPVGNFNNEGNKFFNDMRQWFMSLWK